MKKYLLLLPFLTSCNILQSRLTELEQHFSETLSEHAEAQQAALTNYELRLAEIEQSDLSIDEQLAAVEEAARERDAALSASLSLFKTEAKNDWKNFEIGVKSDVAQVRDIAVTAGNATGGILGFGRLGDLLATAVVGGGGAVAALRKKTASDGQKDPPS